MRELSLNEIEAVNGGEIIGEIILGYLVGKAFDYALNNPTPGYTYNSGMYGGLSMY